MSALRAERAEFLAFRGRAGRGTLERRLRRPPPRGWPRERVLAEYTRWSHRVVRLGAVLTRTPVAGLTTSVADLGTFPVGLALTGALTFDHHVHLRFDLAPALGRTLPPAGGVRTGAAVEWMLAVLGNQVARDRPLARPVALRLTGPGGGDWLVRPDGVVTAGTADTRITSTPGAFVSWGTRRSGWREHEVAIAGDRGGATAFLNWTNVV